MDRSPLKNFLSAHKRDGTGSTSKTNRLQKKRGRVQTRKEYMKLAEEARHALRLAARRERVRMHSSVQNIQSIIQRKSAKEKGSPMKGVQHEIIEIGRRGFGSVGDRLISLEEASLRDDVRRRPELFEMEID